MSDIKLREHQAVAVEHARNWRQTGAQAWPRLCLYYKTGAGKTPTALLCMREWMIAGALVLAPPSTHKHWREWGSKTGVAVEVISHAKFRQKDYKLSRHRPVIIDEFHLLGGHGAGGWSKMDRLAANLQAPLIIMSATPNYNDAERVYCIQHVMDPYSCRGGYLEFLATHCNTRHNQYGMTPLVDKDQPFKKFANAAEYLAALPNVLYLPDDVEYTIEDTVVTFGWPDAFMTYGLNERAGRMVASQMEERHSKVNLALVSDKGGLQKEASYWLRSLVHQAKGAVLVFAQHETVAKAAARSMAKTPHILVTGKTSTKQKQVLLDWFRDGEVELCIGTASLATGTDGLDKVCDTLIILDDTDDDSLRRQLVGRIMPRGDDPDTSKKHVYRLVLS